MVRQMWPHELQAKLEAGEPVHLVDVRQPEEYAICRLAGSQLIPLGELHHRGGEVEPPTGAAVVVYCHHGVRSITGAAILGQQGLENVYSLAGGIDAWSQLIDPAVPRY
jgi:rhodanese-related sulfurtransferase